MIKDSRTMKSKQTASKWRLCKISHTKWSTRKTTTTKTMKQRHCPVIKLLMRVRKYRSNSQKMSKTRWMITLMTRMMEKRVWITLTTVKTRRRWLRLMKSNLDSYCCSTRELWTARTQATQSTMKTASLFYSPKKSTKQPLLSFRPSNRWIEIWSVPSKFT